MTGLDLDSLFLDIAAKEAERRGVQVRLEEGDMRDIPFSGEFDGAYNVFTSFGYLETDAEDQKVLNALGRALKPGGLFLIELMGRDNLMRAFQPRDSFEAENGVEVSEEREFDLLAGRINTRQTRVYPDGRRDEQRHSVRIYALTELARMLGSAGLVVESMFGGLDGSPLSLDSRRMAVLARKS